MLTCTVGGLCACISWTEDRNHCIKHYADHAHWAQTHLLYPYSRMTVLSYHPGCVLFLFSKVSTTLVWEWSTHLPILHHLCLWSAPPPLGTLFRLLTMSCFIFLGFQTTPLHRSLIICVLFPLLTLSYPPATLYEMLIIMIMFLSVFHRGLCFLCAVLWTAFSAVACL